MAVSDVLSEQNEIDDYPITLIEPARGWIPLNLRELWEYRELLFFTVWRDIQVRYRQTILGASWAILQPVFNMIVFSIFFGRLAKIGSDGLPYPIFSYAGLLPWTFFAGGLSRSSTSMVGSASLIKKVYFPRLVIPLSAVITGLPDFLLSFTVLIGMMIYYGITPQLAALFWLPLLLLLAMITSLGVGLWLSALDAQYRDVRYLIPFLTQVWMFATPVVYPASLLSPTWRVIYSINPMVGVVEGFRWVLLGSGHAPGTILLVSTAASLLILIGGAFYFRRMEKTFADVI